MAGAGGGAPEDHGLPGPCPSPGNLRTRAQRDLDTERCLSNETVTASASSSGPPTAPLEGGSGWLSSGVETERTRVALSQDCASIGWSVTYNVAKNSDLSGWC